MNTSGHFKFVASRNSVSGFCNTNCVGFQIHYWILKVTWPPFCAHPDARAAEPPGKVGVWCRTSFLPRSPPLRGMRGCRRAPPVAPKAPRKLAHVSRVKIVASQEKMSTRAVLWTLVAAMIVAAVALAADGPCRRISVTALALLIALVVFIFVWKRKRSRDAKVAPGPPPVAATPPPIPPYASPNAQSSS